ncbi:MAG: MFS transporter [Thermoplasmata archaeon]
MYSNIKLAIFSRVLVSFSYGYIIVILPLYLHYAGYSLVDIALILFVAMLINAVLTFLLGMLSDHYGRRNILAALFLIFSISSLLFLTVRNIYIITILAGLAGFTTGSSGGPIGSGGPFGAIQNAIIAEEAKKAALTKILGIAAVVEMLAAMGGSFFIPVVTYFNVNVYLLFYLSSILALISFISAMLIKDYHIRSKKLLPALSYKKIFRLSIPTIPCGLGSGLILPILSLWLKLRYHVSTATLGLLFGTINIGVVIAILLMPYLADYVGKLKVIVLSRVIASIALLLIAFSPFFLLSAALLVLRGTFAMGAVPVRQSFVMTNVHDTERATTNGATSLSRNSASSVGPLFDGYLMPLDLSLIPLVGGIITMFDPLLYYLMFRDQWSKK